MTLRSLVTVLSLLALSAWAQTAATPPSKGFVDAMRGPVPIDQPTKPPVLANNVNDDQRVPRNYEWQPPVIPHRVDGYQIDKNFNKCLDCHARAKTDFSHAIPVSETHYMDRSGKKLDHLSTRRYFCMQCHVPQEPARPLVGNTFEGFDALMKKGAQTPANKK
ncbi:nitrate reductase cytochrome c-type subunit [Ramlibacter solisilvae]|uniref:Periplasmic nitrate reductase, electron transfer subunit n=1 Tax=Ramlibacter tataouinensis TaxID=94132 RepID=A0A127JYL3_9BURK|nr:nitrate reductase cytochrome c-type subunit [Ramlibacter tataouinensis]AMO25041.1 nitrate reductase [Ramlibacter tataouinensis]